MGWLVFAASLLAYGWTAAPAVGWLDSAELIAASASLGVPHPPGHPVPTLLGRALLLLPVGDAPFRVNLASALAGALAASALYFAAAQAVRRVAPALPGRTQRLVAAGFALGFAATGSAWSQSVRAEVYAVEAALVLGALALLLRFDQTRDRRALLAAGLLTGLALADHHFVTLLFFLPAGAVALSHRPGTRAAALTAMLGVLGLAAYLYLPVRAARDPEVDWGHADRAGRLAWTVSARAFQKALDPPVTHRSDDALRLGATVTEQASPPGILLALVGAYALLRRKGARRAGLLLAGIFAFGAAGRAALGFDADNPDAHGYLLPALGALFALAAAGLAAFAEAVADLRPRATTAAAATVCLLAVALPAWQTARFAAASSLRDGYAADTFARGVLEPLPPRALLVTSFYETTFQLWALDTVDQERPDVTVLDRNLLTHPFAPEAERRRHPELAALLDAPLRGGRPTPVAELVRLAGERPVAFEPAANLDAGDPVWPHLVPRGPVALFLAAPPDAAARADAELRDAEADRDLDRRLASPAAWDRLGAARLITWNAYLEARLYCLLGRQAAARGQLERARRTGSPGDPALRALASACLRGP